MGEKFSMVCVYIGSIFVSHTFPLNTMFKGVPVDFDLSLRYQISSTGHASFNPIFLLKYPTQKVYGDTLSAVIEPPSGSRELIKYETSKAINFGYSYPIFMIFLPFDFKFMCLSKLVLS